MPSLSIERVCHGRASRGTRNGECRQPYRDRRAIRAILMGASLILGTCTGASAQTPLVATTTAERGEVITEIGVSGTVIAPRRADVSPAVAGQVVEVAVQTGDRVQEGDPLVTLDSQLQELTVASARARVRETEAQLAEACRLLEEARAAGARVNIPETEVRARENRVRETRATLERVRAEAEREAAREERHQVRAPFDGVINQRAADPGEWIEPGTPLLELVSTADLYLAFEVPQDVFHQVTMDTELRVQMETSDNASYAATIESIIPVTDDEARTFRLCTTLAEPPPLAAGMSARGVLRLRTGEEGVLVPRDALNRYPEGRITVWIVSTDDGHTRVREQRVSVGEGFGDQVVVREGLEARTTVVVRGNAALEDDQRVEVQ